MLEDLDFEDARREALVSAATVRRASLALLILRRLALLILRRLALVCRAFAAPAVLASPNVSPRPKEHTSELRALLRR